MAPSPAAAARLRRPVVPVQLPAATDGYSRWVALLKVVLPVIGVALLILVSVWPRLPALLESVRTGFPAIDLREARELRMVAPRYAGLDRYNRPYVVTAAVGRQVPDRNDVMALERPRAVMTVHGGASITVTAATGVYQSQAQLLDLFEDVTLLHQDGTRFVTRRAHISISDNSAEGHEPVEGHGPSGDITAEGFLILSKGETILFTGRSSLVLRGTKPGAPATEPPALPAEVDKSAAQIEANASGVPVALPLPAPSPGAFGNPTHRKPEHGKLTHGKLADRSGAAANPRSGGRHVPRSSPSGTPSAVKKKHHGG